MSKEGTIKKALLCLLVLILGVCLGLPGTTTVGAVTLALSLGLAILLLRIRNPLVVLIFSAVTGVAVGGIAGRLQQQLYPSITGNALIVTLVASTALVTCYGMKFVRVTLLGQRIWSIVLIGYLASLAAGASLILIGALDRVGPLRAVTFALLSMLGLIGTWLAAYSLLMDFDWIRKGIASHLDSQWEWHGAFRPLGSYVWFYLEILVTIQLSAALIATLIS